MSIRTFKNNYSAKEILQLTRNHLFGWSKRFAKFAPVDIYKEAIIEHTSKNMKIAFIGDVMPIVKRKLVFNQSVKEFFRDTDIIVLNFEGVIARKKRLLAMRHDEEILRELKRVFTGKKILVNLANNHAADYGVKALQDQVNLLEKEGFIVFGTKQKPCASVHHINFCGVTFWSNQEDSFANVELRNTSAKKLERFIRTKQTNILLPHWGYELEAYPHPQQIKLARELSIKWDAIMGGHSHVPQLTHIENNSPICYSLGDFCFLSFVPAYQFGKTVKLTVGKNKQGKQAVGKVEQQYTRFRWRNKKIIVSEKQRKYHWLEAIGAAIFKPAKYVIAYGGLVFYSLFRGIRLSNLSKLNPDLPLGGYCTIPKTSTMDYFFQHHKASKACFPKTVMLPQTSVAKQVAFIKQHFGKRIVVLKPNQGIRSIGFSIVKNEKEMRSVLQKAKGYSFIAQEFVTQPIELGVFFIRNAKGKQGIISGVAQLRTSHGQAKHSLDETYYSRPEFITKKNVDFFNKISPLGFVFGRFDVRVNSLEDFKIAKDIIILEVNAGPDAVPLHLMDPRFSAKKQLRIFYTHLRTALRIASKHKGKRSSLCTYIGQLLKDQINLNRLKRRMKREQ